MTSRILLADDSITIQKVVNLTFADEGIEVVAVSNGEQAERRLSEICPDLVLADIFMPGKNGYELCEFVKQSPQFRHVPVVLLVGAFEPFNEAEARRVRADAHLTKPFESRTLVDTVRKLISMSGRPATGALPSEPLRGHENIPALTPAPEASSVALPAFNLDLSGMAPDWELAQPAARQENSFADPPDMTPLNNASPLELDYGSFGNSDAPKGFQMEVEERASSAGFSFASSVKDTAELPPIESDQLASVDAAPRGRTEPLHAQPAFSDGELASGPGEAFGAPFEVPEDMQGFKVKSTFGDRGQDSVLDFERLDGPESAAPDNIVSFDVDFSTADAPAAYDAPIGHKSAVETFEQNAAVDASEEFGEMPLGLVQETTPPALSVDDPLGDVLSVEPSHMPPVEHGVNGGIAFFPPQPTEPLQEPVDDASSLSQFPFDIDAAEASSERPGAVIHSGLSFEAFSPVLEEPSSARAEPRGWGDDSNDVLSELIEPAKETPSEVENAFTASEMWAVAETEFAAIDIEAVAVEEPPSLADINESPDGETGFAFASVAEPVAETPAIIAPPKPVEAAVVGTPQAPDGLTLSPALIDEIVRRVVAEMGDAVVREIAWEVVPDCVERVVEKLSHEAAAKRI